MKLQCPPANRTYHWTKGRGVGEERSRAVSLAQPQSSWEEQSQKRSWSNTSQLSGSHGHVDYVETMIHAAVMSFHDET